MYTLVLHNNGEYLVLAQAEYIKVNDEICEFNDGGTTAKASIILHSDNITQLIEIMINLNNNIPKVLLTRLPSSSIINVHTLSNCSNLSKVPSKKSPIIFSGPKVYKQKMKFLNPDQASKEKSQSTEIIEPEPCDSLIITKENKSGPLKSITVKEILALNPDEEVTLETQPISMLDLFNIADLPIVMEDDEYMKIPAEKNSVDDKEQSPEFLDEKNENFDDFSDTDSSNSSHISELDDLEHLDDEMVDDLRDDSSLIAPTNDFNLSVPTISFEGLSTMNFDTSYGNFGVTNLSNLTELLGSPTNNLTPVASTSTDTQVHSPLLDSTLDNNTSAQSNYKDPDFVPDQSDFENSTTLQSCKEKVDVNTLIHTSRAPNLDELDVYEAGDYTKTNFCLYCFEMKVVISRHLQTMHADEPEVKAFMAMKPSSRERRDAIAKIRLKGNDLFNSNKDINDGELLVARQPRKGFYHDADEYKKCHNCNGWFLSIHRHRANCLGEQNQSQYRTNSILSKVASNQFHEKASSLLRKVLAVMNDDQVSKEVRYDPLLIDFANDLCINYLKQQQHDMIRARLRMLGHLLIKMKSFNSSGDNTNNVKVSSFADIIDARNYDNMIRAIEDLVGSDSEKHECRAPSTATSYGTWLIKVAKTLRKESIKKRDYETVERVKYFLDVHEVEYPIKINSLAYLTQIKDKRHRKEALPLTEDISLFRNYLENKLSTAYNDLQGMYSDKAWLQLSQATLILILLFNRKRPGELERILIEDYTSAEPFETSNPEAYSKLSDTQKVLVDKYLRFEFGGKKNREVPILFSAEMQNFVNLIIKNRENAGVESNNPFIFGIPGYDGTRYKHLRAGNLLNRFSKLCKAKYPDRLRATKLRKHFATTIASLDIDECRIYDISNFMGHHENIHRSHYRKTVVTRDVLGVSEFLEMASGSTKTLNEAHIQPKDSKEMHHTRSELLEGSGRLRSEPLQEAPSNKSDSVDEQMSHISDNDSDYEMELESNHMPRKNHPTKQASITVSDAKEGKTRRNTRVPWSNEEKKAVRGRDGNGAKKVDF